MALRRSKIITADVANSTTSLADVTGLEFSASSGVKYWWKFSVIFTTAATTTGAGFAINSPAATLFGGYGQYPTTTSGTTIQLLPIVAINTNIGTASGAGTTVANVAILEGFVQPSATGLVTARFLSEEAASAITVKAGSKVEWHEA